MLRRINKQSCRSSLEPIPETPPSPPAMRLPTAGGNSRHPQERKHFSTFCSPEASPLCVRKEALRPKEKEPILVVREPRVRLKQKTEHFNYKYLEWMRMRRQGVSWVQYNMALGVALLWKKVQDQITHFQQARNLKYNRKFQQQVDSITQEIDSIIQQAQNKTPVPLKQDFHRLFQGRDSAELMSSISTTLGKAEKKMTQSIFFQNHYKTKQHSRKGGSTVVDSNVVSTAAATPNKENSLGHLKESVCKLNSYFCLFKRRITMRKQDQLIGQFLQRRSSQGSFTPSQLQQLQQIMRINQQRCQLMSEIINNVGILKSHESNLLMNQKLLKKIGQIDLMKELNATPEINREEVLKAKMKSVNNIIIEVVEPEVSHVNQTTERDQSNAFADSSHFDISKSKPKKIFQRSSIDNLVSNGKENYDHVSSKVMVAWKDKTYQKSQRIMKDSKKAQMDNSNVKNVGLKKSGRTQDKQKKKLTKKVIGFAVNDEPKTNKDAKSTKNKTKSIKNVKSKKELTWDDLQKRNFRSLKSVKSLKSFKSIGSYSEIGSRKLLRSLKTYREMKYLQGHMRNISYISKYRTKLFKLNGLDDQDQHQTRNFVDVTTDNDDESRSSDDISIKAECNARQSIEMALEHPPERKVMPESNKSMSSQHKSEKFQKVPVYTNKYLSDWPSEKETILRQFLNRFELIEKEKNLAKQKSLILNQLQRMMDAKLITPQMFQRYRTFFEGQRKKSVRFTEKAQVDSENNLRSSLYSNLLNFRQMISNTTELNQINKYYYNIGQFKSEEEQIKMTKQATKPEDFFFNIKTTTEKQNNRVRRSEYDQEDLRQWRPKVLLQKAI